MTNSERSWRSLVATCPGESQFLAMILLQAHEAYGDLGYGHEMETVVSRNVVEAFYSKSIVGAEIARLREYANGDAAKAYDVLTVPEELQAFTAVFHP